MSEDARLLYFGALKKHRNKDYHGAIEDLREAVRLDETLADAWEALGVLYEKTDRLDEAIEATRKLVELQPDEVMGHTNLSRFYMKKGWTEKAEEEQGKARLLGWKQDLASGQTGGDDFAQAGAGQDGPPAIATFLQPGQAPSPPTAPAPRDRETVLRKIAQFEKVAESNPDDVMSRFTLGKLHLEAEQPDRAAEVLEALLDLKSDYTAAFPLLGKAYERSGKLAKAIRLYQKGIELADAAGDLHPRNQMQERLAELTGPRQDPSS
jgi:Flp pilus assembly protein TadD